MLSSHPASVSLVLKVDHTTYMPGMEVVVRVCQQQDTPQEASLMHSSHPLSMSLVLKVDHARYISGKEVG